MNVAGDWFAMMNGEISEEEFNKRYPATETVHKVVRVILEPYGDRIIYDDGTEEWRSIGD